MSITSKGLPAWAREFILCYVRYRPNIEICRPEFSWSHNTGMAITDGLLCPWARGFSPHRVQDMQFHINIDIVARVFLVTRFMHAFCRSRHTNGPEAFSSLHALRSSIHFGIGFVVQRLFWHAIYAWVSRIGLLPGGPTEFAFQDDHVHI